LEHIALPAWCSTWYFSQKDLKGWELRFEHGFSPMHWSAQRGRRDLIEFIRQQVASASAPYELKAKRYKKMPKQN